MTTTNRAAARRAVKALCALPDDGRSEEEQVIDLLSDLRHFCDADGHNFAHLDALAFQHYCEEDGTEQKS